MKFLKYILYCIWDTILLGNSRTDMINTSVKTISIGIISILIIGIIFTFFNIKVYKNKKLSVLYAILSTFGILLIFILLCICIEYIVF